MDEYFETKKKIEEKKRELNDLSNKFKELRSLVFQYRDNKEKEIEILKKNQENFKEEIEKNKEVYEKMIDDAAEKIETFIQKASSDNQIQ
jgi:cell division protein ZapA